MRFAVIWSYRTSDVNRPVTDRFFGVVQCPRWADNSVSHAPAADEERLAVLGVLVVAEQARAGVGCGGEDYIDNVRITVRSEDYIYY